MRGEGGGRRGRAGRLGSAGAGLGAGARRDRGVGGARVRARGRGVCLRSGREDTRGPGGGGGVRGARAHARGECFDARVCVGSGLCLRRGSEGRGVRRSASGAC